jgi:DNA-binding CsgD family transcriptional regulator
MSPAPVAKKARGDLSRRMLICDSLDPAHLRLLGLTRRECEVMRWIGEGKRDHEIATILGLSPRTVGNHAHNIFQKLKVETRTAAARHCALALAAAFFSQ